MLDPPSKSISQSYELQATIKTDDIINEARAFVELVGYIKMSVNAAAGTLVFKLSELHTLYVNRLEDSMRSWTIQTINKTRFEEQLLERFSDARAQHDGRNIVIIFIDGMKHVIKDALKKRDLS